MTTSHTIFNLSKPSGRDKIPEGNLSYVKIRNRIKAFNLVLEELEKSGITKAELADRLGKGSDRIAHLLGAPGNWTLDTLSSLLFAISAATVEYRTSYPLDKNPKNSVGPYWLHDEKVEKVSFQIDQVQSKLIDVFIVTPPTKNNELVRVDI